MKPQLLVEASKVTDAVQFYKTAFGAVEINCNMETKRKAEQELKSRLLAPFFLSLTFPMILLQLRIWESDASSAWRL
ncbi:hypothetical protein WN943_007447 [Citrus x changshan-huyou]